MGGFWWVTGIEDTFVPQASPGRRPLDEYELQQHYRFWARDLDLAAEIGFGMIRYGIPWYRVEPEPGRFDWSFTDQVLPHLAERGLEPIVDLVHYGTPLWLGGEFTNPDYPARVAEYAAAFADRYRDLARYYTPLNEPFINADLCGREGRWPPGLTGDEGFVAVLGPIVRGMAATIEALRAARPGAVIVPVDAAVVRLPEGTAAEERVRLDTERQHAPFELLLGRVAPGSPLAGYLAGHGMSDEDLAWHRDHPARVDVLGLNYYPDATVQRWFTDGDGQVVEEAIWGGGDHLAGVVRAYHDRYGLPILISECCVNERSAARWAPQLAAGAPSERDAFRARWLEEAMAAVRSLRGEGLPLVGFTWWPLLDAVSWEYREKTGAGAEFLEPAGLVRLRPTADGTLLREPLPVASRMRELINGPM